MSAGALIAVPVRGVHPCPDRFWQRLTWVNALPGQLMQRPRRGTDRERAMVEIAGLYFVIANENRARFVRAGPDKRPHTIQVVDHATLSKPTDPPDTEPAARDPTGPEPAAFTRLLAGRVDDDFAADLFSHLVLVAPSRVQAELIALFSGAIAACLIGRLAKDLTAVPDAALWPYLQPWLAPANNEGAPPDEES
jgi:hypothetical protein